jgi:hypothetical protein
MNTTTIAILVFAFILLLALIGFLSFKLKNLSEAMAYKIMNVKVSLKDEISILGKTNYQWNETLIKEVVKLKETTVKAHLADTNELIITSPDGTIIIDEFKAPKTK